MGDIGNFTHRTGVRPAKRTAQRSAPKPGAKRRGGDKRGNSKRVVRPKHR